MQGPNQLPNEGELVKTFVGIGHKKLAHVLAEIKSLDGGTVEFEVNEVLSEGSVEVELGAVYEIEIEDFMWAVPS